MDHDRPVRHDGPEGPDRGDGPDGRDGPDGPDGTRDFAGEFETHVTIGTPQDDPRSVEALARWAESHGIKFTHILLARGRTPSQPMLTLSGTGTLTGQRRTARALAERLTAAGFPVVRTKIEAAPWNDGVPRTAEDARRLPGHCHFEHHVKLRLPYGYDAALLAAVSERHDAHVSRNARRVHADGVQERFVTQRVHGSGRPAARAALEGLLAALTAAGFAPSETEEEFVVEDDNPGVDAGWLGLPHQ